MMGEDIWISDLLVKSTKFASFQKIPSPSVACISYIEQLKISKA